MAFSPHLAVVEYAALTGPREVVKDGALLGGVHFDSEPRQFVSGKAFGQQASQTAVSGDRPHGTPTFSPAIGVKNLVK
ncbi:hypothetical protein MMIN_36700 [Mycolicibacter minnesotensis]|nr:hypothetical protein MMIN_36700 [Mycolicibacter minnesotensis]